MRRRRPVGRTGLGGPAVLLGLAWTLPSALPQQPSEALIPSLGLGVIRCSATSAPPIVRAEGASELLGDVVITCQNVGPAAGTPGRGFFEADISLSLNVDFAGYADSVSGSDVSDAVLVVNGNHCLNPGSERAFGECGLETDTVQDAMLAQWDRSSPGLLRWNGIAFPIPGAAIGSVTQVAEPVSDCSEHFGDSGGCHPLSTTFRLTNIRANVVQLGVTGASAAASVPLLASLSIRARNAEVALAESTVQMAAAAPGLRVETQPIDSAGLCSRGEAEARIDIAEGFATAFKPAGRPRFQPGDPGWRDDFYPLDEFARDNTFSLPGTRLRIALSGLPAGLEVSVPRSVACAAASGLEGNLLELALVDGVDASGFGGAVAQGASTEYEVLAPSTASEAVAVYEITQANPLAQEECRLPLRFSQSGGAGTTPEDRRITVSVHLAPLGSGGADPEDGSRFVSGKLTPQPSFHVRSCGTTLFFPFVTNRSNFDTAILIANTSRDPLGTRYQEGRCTLQYHGSGVEGQRQPSVQTTVLVEAGDQVAFTLSNGNPNQGVSSVSDFQGYLVAVCGFQYARGFAFVTEQVNGTAILAQGYLAETIRSLGEAAASFPRP